MPLWGERKGEPSKRSSMRVIEAGRPLLNRLAARMGLDGDLELAAFHFGDERPDDERPELESQRAFALLHYGLRLYREQAHSQYFPAASRRVKRRGAQGVLESLASPRGERAVVFLSHAVPAFAIAFWECAARRGEIPDASPYVAYHGMMRELLSRHFPLEQDEEQALARARREVDVFETGVPVTDAGVGPATGYGIALRDGGNPTADHELVEVQASYAVFVFEASAEDYALRLGLGDDAYREIELDLMRPTTFDQDAALWRAGTEASWSEVVGDYFDFVRPDA